MLGVGIGTAMFSGKSWTWPAVIITTIIGLVLIVIFEIVGPGGDYLGIIISVIILWYMRKSHVKTYFGRVK